MSLIPNLVEDEIYWYRWHNLQRDLCTEYHSRIRDHPYGNHHRYFKEFYLDFGQRPHNAINFRYLNDVQQSKYNGQHEINYLHKPYILGGICEVPATYYYSSGDKNTPSFS